MKSECIVKKHIIFSIILIFISGFLLHFSYDFFGKNTIVGFFSPINESIWEHLKLFFIPVTVWWILFYIFYKDKLSLNQNKWFLGALISDITGLTFIPFLFYFYTGAFNTESLFIDIFIFLLAIILGQFLGFHFYKYSKGINMYIVFILLSIVMILFIIFTAAAPSIPIFIDYSM